LKLHNLSRLLLKPQPLLLHLLIKRLPKQRKFLLLKQHLRPRLQLSKSHPNLKKQLRLKALFLPLNRRKPLKLRSRHQMEDPQSILGLLRLSLLSKPAVRLHLLGKLHLQPSKAHPSHKRPPLSHPLNRISPPLLHQLKAALKQPSLTLPNSPAALLRPLRKLQSPQKPQKYRNSLHLLLLKLQNRK
jgi:hypothetical protein